MVFPDLLGRTKLDATQHKYITVLNKSAHSLLDIVNDILDFSKIEDGKLELEIEKTDVFEMSSQLVDSLKPYAEEKGLALQLSVFPTTPQFIWADAIRLRQVLTNLLGNAVKFTEKGEIELSIEPVGVIREEQIVLRFCCTGYRHRN